MNRTTFLCCLLIGSVPLSASASTEWATWNTAASNLSSTGSFADGRTVQLTSFFETISGPAARRRQEPSTASVRQCLASLTERIRRSLTH